MENEYLLEIKNLKKHYKIRDAKGKYQYTLKALDDVSFKVPKSTVIGIVGESGCGKSTLGKTVLDLIRKTSGEIIFNSKEVTDMSKKEILNFRRRMQIIFQDPHSSLNRRKTIGNILKLPLSIHFKEMSEKEKNEKVIKMLEEVGLDAEHRKRYPHQFSGGQLQRIAIARALIIEPDFIVADECVSALDVSVQSQILNLLVGLGDRYHFSCLFISHDLKVVEYISNVIYVMYMGKIVEMAKKKDLEKKKYHPYTETLFSSYPSMDLSKRGRNREALGEPVSFKDLPKGCSFCNRCPKVMEQCYTEKPLLKEVESDRYVACHLY